MRGLSTKFLEDLRTGCLSPLLERVRLDRTLFLGIRDEYLNLYYRGGNLLRLTADPGGYQAFFDPRYGPAVAVPGPIRGAPDVADWIDVLPQLKLAMDLWFGAHPKGEREVQQLIARANNVGATSGATDFYVCDLEYANAHGRFDFVAVHWPSTPAERKRTTGRRLALGEVKHGDGALAGKAGLHAHVRDVDRFLSDPANGRRVRDEMVAVFNQQRALGLMNCGRDLQGFSEEPPLLLLVLANHDPDKSALRAALQSLPAAEHVEVRVVAGSLVGYGLFDPGMLTVDQALLLGL